MLMQPAWQLSQTTMDWYLAWLDASLDAGERFARVARVWIDETLGAQRDLAQTVRRAFEDARLAWSDEDEWQDPLASFVRAGDLARSSFFLWTEAGLKTQERAVRVAQTALDELLSV